MLPDQCSKTLPNTSKLAIIENLLPWVIALRKQKCLWSSIIVSALSEVKDLSFLRALRDGIGNTKCELSKLAHYTSKIVLKSTSL